MIGAGWAAIAWAVALIVGKFFSGGSLLAIHAGVIVAELSIKIANRQEKKS